MLQRPYLPRLESHVHFLTLFRKMHFYDLVSPDESQRVSTEDCDYKFRYFQDAFCEIHNSEPHSFPNLKGMRFCIIPYTPVLPFPESLTLLCIDSIAFIHHEDTSQLDEISAYLNLHSKTLKTCKILITTPLMYGVIPCQYPTHNSFTMPHLPALQRLDIAADFDGDLDELDGTQMVLNLRKLFLV